MVDLSQTVAPKSDQLNADDLIGKKSLTIKITDVKGVGGDQPIAIHFEGDGGKPYKPCKSMRRALIFVWGEQGKTYIGKSLTLVRDPNVKFGGIAVGGLRITHMSHIDKQQEFSLTETRGHRKPYIVQPLKVEAAKPAATQPPKEVDPAVKAAGDAAAAEGVAKYVAWRDGLAPEVKETIRHLNGEWSKIAKESDEKDAAATAAGA